jgi:hypoxanthine phosphoribosyltransferase
MVESIDSVLVAREAIAQRIEAMGQQIADDFRNTTANDPNAELTILPVLTGAFIFAADLIRCLPLKMRIELIAVRSYPGAATVSEGPKVLGNLPNLKGHHVLLVEDILDSGQTIAMLQNRIQADCASLRTVTLLRKDRPEAMATPVDYVGFDIPDRFVVGYGLDHDGYYRNLPDVVTLSSSAL